MGKLLVTLGGVVVFVLFAALIAPYFIDWTHYKSIIEERSGSLAGRPVHIDGMISVRLLPQPVLRMSGVRILDDHGGPLLAANMIEARLAIEPLLKSRIEITHIEAVEPVLQLVRKADGTVNWRRVNAAGGSFAGLNKVSVQNLHVQGGRVIYRDEPRDLEKTISSIDADLTAMSLKGPFKISGIAGAGGTSFKVASGRVSKSGELQLSVVASGNFGEARLKGLAKDVFDDLAFGGKLTFRAVEKADGSLPLSLDSEISLRGAALQMRDITGALGEGSVQMRFKGGLALVWKDTPRITGQFSARRADIDGLAGVETGPVNLVDWLGVALSGAPPLLPAGLRGKIDFKVASGLIGGKRFSDLEASVRSDGRQISLLPLKITLPGQAGVEISGRFENTPEALGFGGRFSLTTPDLRAFSTWTGYEGTFAPKRGALGFRIESKIRLNSQEFEFAQARGKLGGAPFKGRFLHSFDNSRNTMNIDIERFDIDRYLRAKAATSGVGEVNFTPVRPSLWVNRFPALLEGKSDLSVRIGTLAHGGASYNNFSSDLRFNDGDLTIHRFAYEAAGNVKLEISGSIANLGSRPQTHLQIKLKSPDATSAVPAVILKKLPELKKGLEALGHADLDLRFTGGEDGKNVLVRLRGGGILGGSKAEIEADFTGVPERVADGKVHWRLKLTNSSAGDLLDQLHFPGHGNAWRTGEGVFAFEGKGTINQLMPFSLSLNLPQTLISLGGTIEKQQNYRFADARFNLKMDDSRLLELRLNGGASDSSPVPLRLTASVEGGLDNLLIAGASGAAGGAPFTAYGRLVLDKAIPRIELNLKPERFNLPLVLGVLFDARGKGDDVQNRIWSSAVLDAARLRGFSLDLDVETPQMRLSNALVLKKAMFNARIGDGVFEIQTLAGQILGGRLLGSVLLEDDGVGALKGRSGLVLEALDLPELLKGAGQREALKGTLSVKAELEARGRSLAGLISSLNGSADIILTGAKLTVPDLFATSLITGAAQNAGELEAAMKKNIAWRAGAYALDKSRASISNGILRIEDTPFILDGRKGKFNLFSDFSSLKMDAKWVFSLPDLKDGPLMGVIYSGTFGALRSRPDISALMRYITSRRIEREAEDSRREAIRVKDDEVPAGVIKQKITILPGLSGAAMP